jgi:polysaccharide deacetylase family protein (PEP-CTERM system associated)
LLNALTIDVEDYFQVSGFERQIPRTEWPSFPSRVEANTDRLLAILDAHQVRGTFFIVGWTAERHPALVQRIKACGHEIGSHSYWHRLVYELSPNEFRADLKRSCDVLSSLTGDPVRLYRAPSFSVVRQTPWALEILAEEGIHIDSSIYPIVHDRYGIPNAHPGPHRIETNSGLLWEVPPAVMRWGRFRVPAGGGAYFRMFPWMYSRFCLNQINRRAELPFVFYLHPWELDPDQPRLRAGTRSGRLRHYANLRHTKKKLELLLQHFQFGTLSQSLNAIVAQMPEIGTPRSLLSAVAG